MQDTFKHYDKYGQGLPLMKWAELLENENYRRIGLTKLWWGGRVSTVWLGLDHSYDPEGPPLTFETMVFNKRGYGFELDCKRYSNLAEARNGHKAMVKKWQNPLRVFFKRR